VSSALGGFADPPTNPLTMWLGARFIQFSPRPPTLSLCVHHEFCSSCRKSKGDLRASLPPPGSILSNKRRHKSGVCSPDSRRLCSSPRRRRDRETKLLFPARCVLNPPLAHNHNLQNQFRALAMFVFLIWLSPAKSNHLRVLYNVEK